MTAMITNLALTHLSFFPLKPTGRMGQTAVAYILNGHETAIRPFDVSEINQTK